MKFSIANLIVRALAWLGNFSYYLDRRDKMTVRRVKDNYGFHNEKEFFLESGISNWWDGKSWKIIY